MLKEVLEYVGQQAVQANKDDVVKIDGMPSGQVAIARRSTGRLELFRVPPPVRNHQALSLQPIVDLAARQAKGEACADEGDCVGSPVIWYSRRDCVTLGLDYSQPLKMLLALEKDSPSYRQPELVLLLRTTFCRCLERAPGLLDSVRRVKFNLTETGGSTVQHGKSSVGRQIEQEITGTGSLPEYFPMDLPIFGNAFAFVGRVQMALEPLPATQQFKLIPLSGDIEGAIAEAEEQIGQRLREMLEAQGVEVPVLYGNP